MDLVFSLTLGLHTAVTIANLLYCLLGVTIGTMVGVLPGLGAMAAISLMLPLTYHMADPTGAIIMLAGIYYGANFGGSTASILLNLPGTPAHAVACFDGYPMSQQGRGGVALFITAIASFVGGITGVILLVIFAPLISDLVFKFGSAEYFAVMLLGLTAASVISSTPPVKNLTMVVFGAWLGIIGTDISSGNTRFTFGIIDLVNGINIVTLAMGLFGVAEIISMLNERRCTQSIVDPITGTRSMWPNPADWKRFLPSSLRGSAVGSFFGALPGTGPTIASFVSYMLETKISDRPDKFGKGAIEGVVAPEAANNAAAQTAFIPTLSLGIPGDAIMALMLAVFIMHGIQPGPMLLTNHPDVFWGLIVSFIIGNLFLLVLNIPVIGLWIKLLSIPYSVIYPTVLVISALGVYSINNNVFDIWLMSLFGIIGFGMRKFGYEPAPVLLGFVLGPPMEEYFRRAMALGNGDLGIFLIKPISAALLGCVLMLLIWTLISAWRGKHQNLS